MRARLVTSIVAAGIMAFQPEPSGAQPDPLRVDYGIGCSGCTIVTTRVLTLGKANDPVLLADRGLLARDGRGRYFAVALGNSPLGAHQIVVFDSTGRYRRALGREGQGPGEFRSAIQGIHVGRGDTLLVVELGRLVSVFGPDLNFVRSFRLPGTPTRLQPLPDGTFLMSGHVSTPSSIAFQYHRLDRDGVVLKSFGREAILDERTGRRTAGSPSPPQIALTRDSASVWGVSHYRFERWGIGGAYISGFEVGRIPWLSGGAPAIHDTVRAGRNITVTIIDRGSQFAGVDSLGLLWTHAMLPIPGRRPGPEPVYTYLREVIDPSTMKVLASEPVEHALKLFNGSNLAFSVSADQDDNVTITIWRVRLQRP